MVWTLHFRSRKNRLFRLNGVAVFIVIMANMLFSEPLASGATKFLGNITTRRKTPADAHFLDLWNQVTPENEAKWGVVEATRNTMSWAWVDSSYNFAKTNKLPFKYHTLIWGNQEPSWIGSLGKPEQLAEVKEWMRLVAERYPDVDYIDVVNEPSSHPASYREALGGDGVTGWDWIIWSFTEARTLFPKARLIINEYNVVSSTALTDGMMTIYNLLKERNLIDGIGLQSHYFSWPITTPEVVKRNLDTLASTGIPIYITEFDATGDDSVQLAMYKTFFPLLWEHPGVAGVTLWGWMQGLTWETDCYLVDRNGVDRPAFTWLKEYISTHKDVVRSKEKVPVLATAQKMSISLSHKQIHFTPASEGYYTFSLSNIAGRVVSLWSERFCAKQGITIALPKCTAGTYILRAVNQGGSTVETRPVVIKE